MHFLLSFLAGVFIGDIWSESGVWLVIFLMLVAVVFFWKK